MKEYARHRDNVIPWAEAVGVIEGQLFSACYFRLGSV